MSPDSCGGRLRAGACVVALSVGTAIAFGVVHDLVTAHVCVEYFTVAHPKIIESKEPVALALAWGVVATWWVGLPLGLMLALAATRGSRPRYPLAAVARLLAVFVAVLLPVALAVGTVGYFVHGSVADALLIGVGIPKDKISRFWFDAFSHDASYIGGLVGGIAVAVIVWRRRGAIPESSLGASPTH